MSQDTHNACRADSGFDLESKFVEPIGDTARNADFPFGGLVDVITHRDQTIVVPIRGGDDPLVRSAGSLLAAVVLPIVWAQAGFLSVAGMIGASAASLLARKPRRDNTRAH